MRMFSLYNLLSFLRIFFYIMYIFFMSFSSRNYLCVHEKEEEMKAFIGHEQTFDDLIRFCPEWKHEKLLYWHLKQQIHLLAHEYVVWFTYRVIFVEFLMIRAVVSFDNEYGEKIRFDFGSF